MVALLVIVGLVFSVAQPILAAPRPEAGDAAQFPLYPNSRLLSTRFQCSSLSSTASLPACVSAISSTAYWIYIIYIGDDDDA